MLQQNNTHKVIFHADDDEDDRMLFSDAVLELDLAVKVKQVEDGQKLLDVLHSTTLEIPEIVFLDINMPGKNGFECLKEIRNAADHLNQLRIIMLSTSRSNENIGLSYELGADFYAVKPSTFQGLKKMLSHIITLDWSISTRNKKEFLLT